jgi:hypothetical protein
MNYRRSLFTIIVTSALSLSLAAEAGTLGSGPVQGHAFICRSVNIGPINVRTLTVSIVNSSTASPLSTETCSDVGTDRTCQVSWQEPVDAVVAHCRVTSSDGANGIRATFIVDGDVVDVR